MTPTLRTLSILQWVGTFLGASIFVAEHLVGFGITQARCQAAGFHRIWEVEPHTWMIAMMAASGTPIVLSLAAATIVFMRTRHVEYGDGPVEARSYRDLEPQGRIHFFATASIASNVLFLGIVLLDGFGTVFNVVCRQS